MEMETVKLSSIVMKLVPELYPFLKQQELDTHIILRDGLDILDAEGAFEIIQNSIYQHQKDVYIQ